MENLVKRMKSGSGGTAHGSILQKMQKTQNTQNRKAGAHAPAVNHRINTHDLKKRLTKAGHQCYNTLLIMQRAEDPPAPFWKEYSMIGK